MSKALWACVAGLTLLSLAGCALGTESGNPGTSTPVQQPTAPSGMHPTAGTGAAGQQSPPTAGMGGAMPGFDGGLGNVDAGAQPFDAAADDDAGAE